MLKNIPLLIIALLILFFTIFGKNGFIELLNFQSKYHQLQKKLISLESSIQNDSDTLYGLEESPEYLEQVAREDLGLSKEGEIIYIYDPSSRKNISEEKPKENN